MTPRACDVVIVGAGLAGLSAAVRLLEAGRDVHIVEASDAVGGRVRTDHVDGLTLDRGFQLYNSGYRDGVALLDYSALDLRPLAGGVIVSLDGASHHLGDPRREPRWALEALRDPVAPRRALARFAAHVTTLLAMRTPESRDEPAGTYLRRTFGPELTDRVLRPFLSGVLLDNDLAAARWHVDDLLRTFATGRPSLPAGGMQRIPEQLAARVGADRIHLNTTAIRVSAGSVTTDAGPITCSTVIVATDPRTAHGLVPAIGLPRMHGVTTWYHIADCSPSQLTSGRAAVVVDGRRFAAHTVDAARPLANSVVLTHAAPEYASGGRVLVSSSAVGEHGGDMDATVLGHLGRLHAIDTSRWELAARYSVPDSLPATAPGRSRTLPVDVGDGLIVAGDHRDAASIDGAMASGRRAAAAVLAR